MPVEVGANCFPDFFIENDFHINCQMLAVTYALRVWELILNTMIIKYDTSPEGLWFASNTLRLSDHCHLPEMSDYVPVTVTQMSKQHSLSKDDPCLPDWIFHPLAFQVNFLYWDRPHLDLFAVRWNALLLDFIFPSQCCTYSEFIDSKMEQHADILLHPF